MTTSKERDKEHGKGHLAMNTPPIVSQQEWEAARQQMLVKEKAFTRSRDALAAERRRMPWMAVEKTYQFEGPQGKVSLLDLFEGRRQLIVYRAFFEPGVFGWPEHACRGCSLSPSLLLALSLRVDIGNAPFIRICSDFVSVVLLSGILQRQRCQSSAGGCPATTSATVGR